MKGLLVATEKKIEKKAAGIPAAVNFGLFHCKGSFHQGNMPWERAEKGIALPFF